MAKRFDRKKNKFVTVDSKRSRIMKKAVAKLRNKKLNAQHRKKISVALKKAHKSRKNKYGKPVRWKRAKSGSRVKRKK